MVLGEDTEPGREHVCDIWALRMWRDCLGRKKNGPGKVFKDGGSASRVTGRGPAGFPPYSELCIWEGFRQSRCEPLVLSEHRPGTGGLEPQRELTRASVSSWFLHSFPQHVKGAGRTCGCEKALGNSSHSYLPIWKGGNHTCVPCSGTRRVASVSMYVYQCMCICACVSVHVYQCVCICACVSVHVYLCICVCVSVHVYLHMYLCICVCVSVHVYLCMCIYVCVTCAPGCGRHATATDTGPETLGTW